MADDAGYYDSEGHWVPNVKGRALGSTKDFQDTSGLAAAAEANRKKKAPPAPSPGPSSSPDPATMSPLLKASYEAKKKREAQAKAAEKP